MNTDRSGENINFSGNATYFCRKFFMLCRTEKREDYACLKFNLCIIFTMQVNFFQNYSAPFDYHMHRRKKATTLLVSL